MLVLSHWYIKSIYNEFAIAKDFTLKLVPFSFCSVQVMPLFRISFWLLRRGDEKFSCSGLRFFVCLYTGIFEANTYTSKPPDLEIAVLSEQNFYGTTSADRIATKSM